MTQIPILNGIFTDENSDLRTSYPRNLVPVPKQQGISAGYLRPADGIISTGDGPGVDRGGISWNGVHYRVMGSKLVSLSSTGVVTTLGDVDSGGQVSLDYSFDNLAIASNNRLFYWNGSALSEVTDVDLGNAVDVIWVDGYFMTTDGEFLIVTELTNPLTILTTKYGSSEADPDPVKALLKLSNEPYALNRYTIEVFDNIGGTGFPFQRIEGAQIQRGTVGTHTCCIFLDSIAFVGGGRNESIAVWLAGSGSSVKISTREIDQILSEYTEDQLSEALVEAKVDQGHQHLFIHLPDQTLVYDGAASQVLSQPVWFSMLTDTMYRGRNLVYVHNRWWVGDPLSFAVGYLTNETSDHWGNVVNWEFGTSILYNEGNGALVHKLELVCLSGRANIGVNPTISTQYSADGETWSTPRYINAGKQGERNKRLVWLQQGPLRHWRIQRFRGTSEAHLSIARLEVQLEALSW